MSDSPMPRPAQLDSPFVKTGMKYVAKAPVWAYRRTKGRIGGTWRSMAGWRKPAPVLLLDHVVGASQGGMAMNPQWFHDLRASPDTQVQVGAELRLVRAHVASAAERASLWPRLVELDADFETYQTWTDREIPVVVLSPR